MLMLMVCVAIVLFIVAAWLAVTIDSSRRKIGTLRDRVQESQAESARRKKTAYNWDKLRAAAVEKVVELEARNKNLDKVIESKNLEITNLKEAFAEEEDTTGLMQKRIAELLEQLATVTKEAQEKQRTAAILQATSNERIDELQAARTRNASCVREAMSKLRHAVE